MKTNTETFQGIIWMTLLCALAALGDGTVRFISMQDYPVIQIMFFRSVLCAIFLAPIMLKTGGGPKVFKTKYIKAYTLRAVFAFIGMWSWFYILKHAPFTQFIAIGFSSTLFTALFAIVFLKEKYEHYKLAALIIGFLGVLVVIRPGFVPLNLYLLIAIVSSVFWATSLIFVKKLAYHEPAINMAFYLSVMFIPLTGFFSIATWQWPTQEQTMLIILYAIFGTTAQICLSKAFNKADLSILMPFEFTILLFSAIFAYFVFGEIINLWTVLGGIIILSSGYLIITKERRKHISEELEVVP